MSKLNKKGFTLIELLAVIAILAILMLLVTPQILTLFTQGKKNTFAIQVQAIYKRADEEFLAGAFNISGGKSSWCHVKGTSDESLNLSLDDAMSYSVTIDPATGYVTKLIAHDDTYYFDSTKLELTGAIKVTDVKDDNIKNMSDDYTKLTCTSE